MPIIPDKPTLQGSWQPSAPSPSVAAQPGMTLAGLGQDIAQLGQQATGIMKKVADVNDRDGLTKARIAIAQAKADHAGFRASNPDQTTWEEDIQSRLKKVREETTKYQLTPDGRRSLDENLSIWSSDLTNTTKLDATTYGITRARQNDTNLETRFREAGDFESARNVRRSGVTAGLYTAEEAEEHIIDIDKEEKTYLEKKEEETEFGKIQVDPKGYMEQNKTRPENVDPVRYERRMDYARGKLRDQTVEAVDAIHDGMASGDITKPEQIDDLGSDLRPAVRASLKSDLASMGDAAEKTRRSTPEYQAETVGKVSAMLATYNPQGDGFDSDFVQMDSMVRSLPPGAVKEELDRQLKSVREGKLAGATNRVQAGFKAMDEAYKNKRFHSADAVGPQEMPTSRLLHDGFLSDAYKLESLGLTEDQVMSVVDATDGKGNKTLAAQVTAFRALGGVWDNRENVWADPFTQKAADAILNNEGKVSYISDEDADKMVAQDMQAQMSLGRAKTAYADWCKQNPDASSQEIENKAISYAGEEVRAKMASGLFEEAPSRGPKGAADATSATPVGKNLVDVVKNFEAGGAEGGFHRAAYWDYGQWSIGYGTKAKEGEVITKEEADARLNKELSDARADVKKITQKAGISLQPHEEDALTSFTYNLGSGGLNQLIQGGKRSKAEIGAAMLYYRNAGNKRLKGLENRRKAEQQIFLHGYPGNPPDDTYKNKDFIGIGFRGF